MWKGLSDELLQWNKNKLIDNEITKKVKDYSKNRSDLNTYYNVGKLLSEAGKHYVDGIIKEYSNKLTIDLKKYSVRVIYKMRKFYEINQKNADIVCTIILVTLLWIIKVR